MRIFVLTAGVYSIFGLFSPSIAPLDVYREAAFTTMITVYSIFAFSLNLFVA